MFAIGAFETSDTTNKNNVYVIVIGQEESGTKLCPGHADKKDAVIFHFGSEI